MKKLAWIICSIAVAVGLGFLLHQSTDTIANYPSEGTDIIALGDSLVKGIGASEEDKTFVALLSKKINQPIINLGISGNTTQDVLERVNELDHYNPKVVIVLVGGNDALRRIPSTETFQNLSNIIEEIQKRGAIVLLLGVKGTLLGDAYEAKFEDLRDTYHTAYVANVLDGLFGDATFMADGIHPNDKGNERIAEKVYPVLESLLK